MNINLTDYYFFFFAKDGLERFLKEIFFCKLEFIESKREKIVCAWMCWAHFMRQELEVRQSSSDNLIN